MSLRGRVTLASAAVVAVTVITASLVSYFVLRSALLGDVSDRLTAQALVIARAGGPFARGPRGGATAPTAGATARVDGIPGPPVGVLPDGPPGRGAGGAERGGPIAYAQLLDASGTAQDSFGPVAIPVTAADRAIAAGTRGDRFSNRTVDAVKLRVLTFHREQGGGAQVAQPLTDVDNALGNLALLLVLVCAGGTALAAWAAWIVSRRVVAPITELSEAASRIEQTGDLDHRIETTSTDEVGTLALRFNAMLDRLRGSRDALEDSLEAQQQFVADASHELRTPVTSIRTNAELLAEDHDLAPEERRAMAHDIADQAAEMTAMMTALIELARGDTGLHEAGRVKLADVVRRETERLKIVYPGVEFACELDESVAAAHPGLIGRVVGNLLDNAAKFSPPDGTVEVALTGGTLTVTDHGVGIPEADQAHVFDRFYRGERSRALPGSGLGLAIVKQVVEAHGGSVRLWSREGEGTTVTLMLPAAEADGS